VALMVRQLLRYFGNEVRVQIRSNEVERVDRTEEDLRNALSTPRQIVAYWLVPAEPARNFLVALIASLAARLEAVVFEPHLTIYVTDESCDEPAILLRRTFRSASPYRLKVRNIDTSDAFTKTLFMQFEPNARLTRLNAKLRRDSGGGHYELNPHLSLIYKKLDTAKKRKIAQSIQLPFAEVRFDTAKAVISPAQIKSRADVEAWRVVAERKLTK
jgi:hypothetical protein